MYRRVWGISPFAGYLPDTMRELSDAAIAAIYEWASGAKTAEWNQVALSNVLTMWSHDRPEDVRLLTEIAETDTIGVHVTRDVGEHGDPVPVRIEPAAVPENELVAEFQYEWMSELRGVIRDAAADSMFNALEFVLFIGDRADGVRTAQMASVVDLPTESVDWLLLRVQHQLQQAPDSQFIEAEFAPSDVSYSTSLKEVLAAEPEELPVGTSRMVN